MQDEVNDKTLNLCIQAGRITANTLKAAMRKYLNDMEKRKNLKIQKKNVSKNEEIKVKARDKAEKKLEAKKPRGKQTMKQLMNQGVQLTNIPITDDNIKSFERIARKTESQKRYRKFHSYHRVLERRGIFGYARKTHRLLPET